jgi:hypothetical protein
MTKVGSEYTPIAASLPGVQGVEYLSALLSRARSKLAEAMHATVSKAAENPSDLLGDCQAYLEEIAAALPAAKPTPLPTPKPPVPVEDSGVHVGWPRWIRWMDPYDEGSLRFEQVGELAKARLGVFPRSVIQVPVDSFGCGRNDA